MTGAGLLRGAVTDKDAHKFIEYLVSFDAQQYFVDETFEHPLIDGIGAPEGLAPIESLVNAELDLSDLESLEVTQEFLTKCGLI